jgi:hypothetical protein
MAISKLPEQVVAEDLLETPTRPFLLEQGLHFIQLYYSGNYVGAARRRL